MVSRVCSITGKQFEISPIELEWCKHFELPLPSVVLNERLRVLLSFYNQARFFWTNCSLSGEQIVSYYPASAPFALVGDDYDPDVVDPCFFAQEYSFKKPFFSQLFMLWKAVPREAFPRKGKNREQSFAVGSNLLDCFFVWNSSDSKNTLYSTNVHYVDYCMDCHFVSNSNNCYECVDCHNCENLKWSEQCSFCVDSNFVKACKNCKNCLFCFGLSNKEFCVFNQQVTAESYQEILANWDLYSRSNLETAKEKFAEFSKSFKDNQSLRSKESLECSDIINCCSLFQASNCLEGCASIGPIVDSAGFVGIYPTANKVINSVFCGPNVTNLTYCSDCQDCSDLFACVGLKQKQYCILNKQYSKESYFKVVALVKEHLMTTKEWGKFFPINFSAFPYNCSAAGDYLPLTEIQADILGYNWDVSYENLQPSMILKGVEREHGAFLSDSPNSLKDISLDRLTDTLFVCEISGKVFGIIPEEFQLYQKLGAPPPGRAFEQRYKERLTRVSYE